MERVENREYKSDVFSMLMEEPEYALEVYNVLNGSNIEDPSIVEMVTLAKGISLSVRNDAAFIVDMDMNIYEHQSSYNPNMPLRSILYFAEIIKSILKDRDLFSRHQIMIPAPQFIVFYNGIENRPEYEEQRLSDAYCNETKPSLELICKIYNINDGYSKDILSKCSVLKEYMTFVNIVRKNVVSGIENPIDEAILFCIDNNILERFLISRRNEVLKIMTIDMTFERREKLIRIEEQQYGRAEGRAEGIAKGRIDLIKNAISSGMSDEDIIRLLKVDKSEINIAKKQ